MQSSAIDDYVMGRTSHEYQRLRLQSRDWEEVTKRILRQAGLKEGMSCLDVGCGPGEVMRVMGEIAGPQGSITGLDIDGKIGNEALDLLRATTHCRFSFLAQDVTTSDEVCGAPFDIVYARLLLFHMQDPVSVLRKMYRWTKPGGTLVVQDYDLRTADIYPRLTTWDTLIKTTFGVMERSGRDAQFGHKLPSYFVDAGIGEPDGIDVTGLLGSLKQYGGMYLGVYKSLLPRALQMGLVTESENDMFLRELAVAINSPRFYSALWPLLVSVWKRKPCV